MSILIWTPEKVIRKGVDGKPVIVEHETDLQTEYGDWRIFARKEGLYWRISWLNAFALHHPDCKLSEEEKQILCGSDFSVFPRPKDWVTHNMFLSLLKYFEEKIPCRTEAQRAEYKQMVNSVFGN